MRDDQDIEEYQERSLLPDTLYQLAMCSCTLNGLLLDQPSSAVGTGASAGGVGAGGVGAGSSGKGTSTPPVRRAKAKDTDRGREKGEEGGPDDAPSSMDLPRPSAPSPHHSLHPPTPPPSQSTNTPGFSSKRSGLGPIPSPMSHPGSLGRNSDAHVPFSHSNSTGSEILNKRAAPLSVSFADRTGGTAAAPLTLTLTYYLACFFLSALLYAAHYMAAIVTACSDRALLYPQQPAVSSQQSPTRTCWLMDPDPH